MSDIVVDQSGPVRYSRSKKAVSLIYDKFFAFETPLSVGADNQLPEQSDFSVETFIKTVKRSHVKLGMWVDLTDISRCYDNKGIEENGVRYLQLDCGGCGQCPTYEQTHTFVQACKEFITEHPLEMIGIHCTHGFNITGYFMIRYLMEIGESDFDPLVGRLIREKEPFSVRLKEFWDVTEAGQLLSDELKNRLAHPMNELIFQPSKELYRSGSYTDALKWKPESSSISNVVTKENLLDYICNYRFSKVYEEKI